MKINPLLTHSLCLKNYQKAFRIMKLSFFILFVFVCQLFALNTDAQNVTIELKSNKLSIEELFKEIEKQTDYLVIYSTSGVRSNFDLSLTKKKAKVSEHLDEALRGHGLKYEFVNNYIILSKQEESIVQQNKVKIEGVVFDPTGEPVIGANVMEKGTVNGVITDIDGRFFLEVASNATLVISYIGYKTEEVAVANKHNLSITLKEDSETLEEVVVVGYGTQKKVNLTGAVSSVKGEDISKRPVANTSTMLQGQIPGLRVTSDKGQPGSESVQFRIRGQGTYSSAGSDPLILINGVEGDLSTLDPNIIESVSVLKDAASASIYGARAANGVILVTTKSGESIKDKVAISYRGNYAIHAPINLLDLVWDSPTYMKYWNIAKKNSGKPVAEMYTQEMIDLYTNPSDPEKYPSFNWLDYMFVNPFVQQHNLNALGSSGRTSYNVSLSMINQPGTLRGHKYKRYNMAIDLSSSVNDWIKLGAYFSGSRSSRRETRRGDTDAYLSTISQAPTYMPWLPDDGSGVRKWAYKAYVFEANNKNMAALVNNENFIDYTTTDVNTQLWLDVKLGKGLTWYTKGAVRYNQRQSKDWASNSVPLYYTHTGDFGIFLNKGGDGLTNIMYTSTYLNLYTYLKYDWSLADNAHAFSAMAGYSVEDRVYNHLEGYKKDFTFNLHELDAGENSTQTTSGYSEEWALMSGFFRLNYNYKEKYLAEVNARYDGSSRIAPETRWGVFPSFSVGWRITEEDWFKDLNQHWLTNAKLRGSWGTLGNQNVSLYSYYAKISADMNYTFDNTTLETGAGQKKISNRNLKWETTAITDIGVDLSLFNSLNITFEWYKKKTYDILRQAQSSFLLGLDAPYINDGELENKGIEFDIQYANTIQGGLFKGLYYNAGFHIDRSRNELTKFGATEYGNGLIYQEGLPYGSFYAWDAIGIFKDEEDVKTSPKQFNDETLPGDIKYRDVSGPDGVPDGIVDSYDKIVVDGRFPKFEYSINLSASWKGFDLSLMGQGVQGVKHYAVAWGLRPFYQGSPISYDYIENMWTEENPNGKYPRLYYDNMGGTKNTRESTYWIHNASYFRLKNLTFGYTVPKELTQKIRVNKLRFYFSGDNLLTFTKFPQGGDPERNYNSMNGTRLVYYPQNKVYSLGINVEF